MAPEMLHLLPLLPHCSVYPHAHQCPNTLHGDRMSGRVDFLLTEVFPMATMCSLTSEGSSKFQLLPLGFSLRVLSSENMAHWLRVLTGFSVPGNVGAACGPT